jgi:hypothetical protein
MKNVFLTIIIWLFVASTFADDDGNTFVKCLASVEVKSKRVALLQVDNSIALVWTNKDFSKWNFRFLTEVEREKHESKSKFDLQKLVNTHDDDWVAYEKLAYLSNYKKDEIIEMLKQPAKQARK